MHSRTEKKFFSIDLGCFIFHLSVHNKDDNEIGHNVDRSFIEKEGKKLAID